MPPRKPFRTRTQHQMVLTVLTCRLPSLRQTISVNLSRRFEHPLFFLYRSSLHFISALQINQPFSTFRSVRQWGVNLRKGDKRADTSTRHGLMLRSSKQQQVVKMCIIIRSLKSHKRRGIEKQVRYGR